MGKRSSTKDLSPARRRRPCVNLRKLWRWTYAKIRSPPCLPVRTGKDRGCMARCRRLRAKRCPSWPTLGRRCGFATRPGGPCGHGVYRQLRALGHDCTVVAPSLIPRRPGDRIKTDRRDALSLARLFRNGELTPVWVPDEAQEAMRDLERYREDFKHTERRIRQRLNSFLLRHGRDLSRSQSLDATLTFAGWRSSTRKRPGRWRRA